MPYEVDDATRRFFEQQSEISGRPVGELIDAFTKKMTGLEERTNAPQAWDEGTQAVPPHIQEAVPLGLGWARDLARPTPEMMRAHQARVGVTQPPPLGEMDLGEMPEPTMPEGLLDVPEAGATPSPDWQREQESRQYQPEGYEERIKAMMPEGTELPSWVGQAGAPTGTTLPSKGVWNPDIEQDLRKTGGLKPSTVDYKTGGGPQRVSAGGGLGDAAYRAKQRGQRGAVTPSRQLPSAQAPISEVQERESPLVQRLWAERKMDELGLRRAQSGARQEEARANLLETEAELASLPWEEQLNRYVQRAMAIPTFLTRMIQEDPSVQQEIDNMYTLALQNNPELTPQEKKLLRKSLEQKFASQAMQRLMVMAGLAHSVAATADPAAASNVARASASPFGSFAMPTTTETE